MAGNLEINTGCTEVTELTDIFCCFTFDQRFQQSSCKTIERNED